MTKQLRSIVVAALIAASASLPQSAFAQSTLSISPTEEPHEEPELYLKILPPIEKIALPSEQTQLNDFVADLARAGADPAAILSAGDKALSRLPAPTELRGFVQFVRASALQSLNRQLDALDAIQESVRLLPGYSAPLIGASSIYGFLDRPGEGADYLMRAIDVDPQTVRTVHDYEINNLISRLKAHRDERRTHLLSDRLLNIGWIGTGLRSRSALAADAIKRRVNETDLSGARTLVPKLLVPDDSYALLMQEKFRPLWSDVETWAGQRLERQWTTYLVEERSRWTASKSSEASLDYLSALNAAGHHETAARDILPLLEQPDKLADIDLVAVPVMANSLARLNRWRDGERLFERAQAAWPLEERANALNIAANHAIFLLLQGRSGEALKRMDEAIAHARKWGPEVGSEPLAMMHHYRACMLHELGRDSEAGVSMAIAVAAEGPAQVASLHLCMGDTQTAKKALIASLELESLREKILSFVQIPSADPLPSDYAKRMRAAEAALRRDPDVLKAIAKYGRIVPWAVNAGAPPQAL